MSIQTPNGQLGRRLLLSVATAVGLTLGGAVIASATTGNSTVKPSVVVTTPIAVDSTEANDIADAVNALEENDVADASETNGVADEVDGANEVDDANEVDGVDCEDGIDSKTGAECDGGPAANATEAGE